MIYASRSSYSLRPPYPLPDFILFYFGLYVVRYIFVRSPFSLHAYYVLTLVSIFFFVISYLYSLSLPRPRRREHQEHH